MPICRSFNWWRVCATPFRAPWRSSNRNTPASLRCTTGSLSCLASRLTSRRTAGSPSTSTASFATTQNSTPQNLRPQNSTLGLRARRMGIRTGEELLQSLRDGRQLFIDGERVGEVSTAPRFAAAARSLAELSRMQHDPALIDRITFRAPASGERVGLSFIEPHSVEDLIRRRDMVKIWMDATCGMFGRSPDFMNIFFTGFASAADEFGKNDRRFADNVRTYQAQIRENDICLTHTLVNPQVDRSRPVEKQDKDLAAKIIKETDAGIVIRGARMVSTLCAYAHDLLVLPSTYLANSKEAEPYAFGFSVAVAASGLRFICRPSVIHQNAASVMDYPLSARFDETDAMVVFDDVLVPWERVFIHRDPELCNGLYNRTGIMPQIMHQFSTKNLAKAEFMMGLAFAIAKSTNIDQHLHVQGMLAELIQYTEFS